MDIVLLAFIFYIAGAITRTVVAYLAKIVTAPEGTITFNAKYWATMILSVILSFVAGVGTFTAVPIPAATSWVLVLAATFPLGYAINDGINITVDVATKLQQKGSA